MTRVLWPTRPVPAGLRARYLAEGWWTDETLGGARRSIAAGRARRHREHLVGHAAVARDVRGDPRRRAPARHRACRTPASNRGDVVAFQLPNWREAVVAFYGLAMGGLRPRADRAHLRTQGSPLHPRRERGARLHLGRPLRPRRLPRHRRRCRARRAAEPRAARRRRRPVSRRRARACAESDGTSSTRRHRLRRSSRRRCRCGRSRRRVRARVHVGDDERPQGRDAHATGRCSPSCRTSRVDHARRTEPDGIARHARDRHARRGARADGAGRRHPPHRPLGSGPRARRHARSRRRRGNGRVGVPRQHPRPSRISRPSTHGASGGSASAARRSRSRSGSGLPRTGSRSCGRTGRPSIRRSAGARSTIRPTSATAPTAGPCPGVEIRLVDDDGVDVAPGEAGEIWSRGPDLCVGYTDPALTASRVRRRRLVPHAATWASSTPTASSRSPTG